MRQEPSPSAGSTSAQLQPTDSELDAAYARVAELLRARMEAACAKPMDILMGYWAILHTTTGKSPWELLLGQMFVTNILDRRASMAIGEGHPTG